MIEIRTLYMYLSTYFYRRIQRRVFSPFCPPIKAKGCFPSLTTARDRQSPYRGGHVTTPRGVCVETTRGRYVAPSAVRDHSSSILFSLINRVIVIMHSWYVLVFWFKIFAIIYVSVDGSTLNLDVWCLRVYVYM